MAFLALARPPGRAGGVVTKALAMGGVAAACRAPCLCSSPAE